jgi:hypothetical protein
VGAAGILGDVSSQAARPLAGRVGSVAHPKLADVSIQVKVDYTGFNDSSAVLLVYFQDVVHLGKNNLDAASRGNGSSTQAGA